MDYSNAPPYWQAYAHARAHCQYGLDRGLLAYSGQVVLGSAPMSTPSDRSKGRVHPRRMAPLTEDSPYEKARKRLEKLQKVDATPAPPAEVMNLKSVRALEDWEDLMLCQDPDVWGATDLMLAAQLVCMQEMARGLQFRVQTLGEETEIDRWGNRHPSAAFRMWHSTLQMIHRMRGSMGIQGGAVADPSERRANRKAKKLLGKVGAMPSPASATALTYGPGGPPLNVAPTLDDLKGKDLTA